MKHFAKLFSCAVLSIGFGFSASAGPADKFPELAGYTVTNTGVVTGHYNDAGEKEVTFNGCGYYTKLIIDDDYTIICRTSKTGYSYKPKITILSKGDDTKAIIGGRLFNITMD